MNKLTRTLAAGVTSIIAAGALAVPASASDANHLQNQVCTAVNPEIVRINRVVADGAALVAPQQTAVDNAEAVMDAAGTKLGGSALRYIKALDGDPAINESVSRASFIADAGAFSAAVTTWIDLVNKQRDSVINTDLNDAVNNYLKGLCPPATLN